MIVAILTGHGESGPHPLWTKQTWNTIRQECKESASILGVEELIFKELPAACLDVTPAWEINSVIDDIIKEYDPIEIYIPFAFDLHKDHGAISYAVSVATRPYLASSNRIKRVLAYETLSETHLAPPYLAPAFQPNVFVDISHTINVKLRAMKAYNSQLQADTSPRSINALQALATLRGSQIGTQAAEAFVLIGEYQRNV